MNAGTPMTADILDFAVWRACLRAETQPAPAPEPLSPKERSAIALAARIFSEATRKAARLNRQGQTDGALQELGLGYAELMALTKAYPLPVIRERMQIMGVRYKQASRRRAKP